MKANPEQLLIIILGSVDRSKPAIIQNHQANRLDASGRTDRVLIRGKLLVAGCWVLVVQTNLLNKIPHPSTIICPLTTNVQKESEILRVHIKKGTANLNDDCDIMTDQVRAIDNNRLIKKIGELPESIAAKVTENLAIILDIN